MFLVVLVLFGPRRLPDIARQLGKVATELRRAAQNFRDQVMQMDRELPRNNNLPAPLGSSKAPVSPNLLSPDASKPKDDDLPG